MVLLARTLILITLFALPLFPMQASPQISYVLFALAALLLPVFVRVFREVWGSWTTRFFIAFLIASAVSMAFSIDRGKSFMQLGVYVSSFIVFVTSGRIFADQQSKERLALVLIGITTVMSVISLYHTLVLHYVSRLGRGVSFAWVYFGHNHLSALLIFAIPLCFYFVWKYWNQRIYRALFLFVSCYLLFSLFFTFARASILSLVAATVVSSLFFGWVPKERVALLVSLWTLVAVLAFGAVVTRFGVEGFSVVSKNELGHTERLAYARKAIENMFARPLYGTGLDTYQAEGFRQSLQTVYAHNFFFQILSDAGILGFVASIGLIVSVLWTTAKTVLKNRGATEGILLGMFWVGLFASTINTFIDFDWQLPTVFFLFWLLAGI